MKSTCKFCSKGHYTPKNSSTYCRKCEGGQYLDSAQNACRACPAGQSPDGIAERHLHWCTPGQTPNNDNTECDTCELGRYGTHTSLVMIAPSGSIKTTRGRLRQRLPRQSMVWPCLTKTDGSALLCQTLSVSLARQIVKPPEELQALTPKTHACAQRHYSTNRGRLQCDAMCALS